MPGDPCRAAAGPAAPRAPPPPARRAAAEARGSALPEAAAASQRRGAPDDAAGQSPALAQPRAFGPVLALLCHTFKADAFGFIANSAKPRALILSYFSLPSFSCSVPSSARPGAAPRRKSRSPAPPLRAPRRRPARNPGSGPGTGSGRAALLPRRLKGRPTSAGWAAPGVGFPVPEVSRGPALAAAARPRCARVLPAAPPGSDSLSDV